MHPYSEFGTGGSTTDIINRARLMRDEAVARWVGRVWRSCGVALRSMLHLAHNDDVGHRPAG